MQLGTGNYSICRLAEGLRSEVRGPRSEIRGPRSEIRGPRSEIRGPEARNWDAAYGVISLREARVTSLSCGFRLQAEIEPQWTATNPVIHPSKPTSCTALSRTSVTPCGC